MQSKRRQSSGVHCHPRHCNHAFDAHSYSSLAMAMTQKQTSLLENYLQHANAQLIHILNSIATLAGWRNCRNILLWHENCIPVRGRLGMGRMGCRKGNDIRLHDAIQIWYCDTTNIAYMIEHVLVFRLYHRSQNSVAAAKNHKYDAVAKIHNCVEGFNSKLRESELSSNLMLFT